MSRAVSISKAKNQLSAMIKWMLKHQEDVIIENRGQAEAVLIPYADYPLLQQARERQRREDALAELAALAQQVSRRNRDLTPDQAARLAERFTRDVITELTQEGKIQYSPE